jgi:hypothetical protein
MTDLRSCTKIGVGFAVVAGLSATMAFAGGSDAIDGSVTIPGVPFTDTGSTVGLVDDWDEVCPYTGSTAGDAFYRFTPAATDEYCISVCNSNYDTKLYVLDAGLAALACVDDSCSSPGGGGFRSNISLLTLAGGAPVDIGVDGWNGATGNYEITVDVCGASGACCLPTGACLEAQFQADCDAAGGTWGGEDTLCLDLVCEACSIDCPPGSTLEGEICDDVTTPPNDTVNGGCNSTPPVFTAASCGDVVCGSGWFNGSFRDTDWYELTFASGAAVTLTADAQFDILVGFIEQLVPGVPGCANITGFFEVSAVGGGCGGPVGVALTLGSGTYYTFVGPQFTNIVTCGSGDQYTFTTECAVAPCCNLGDSDEDGDVDFDDLLNVLTNWGTCPAG